MTTARSGRRRFSDLDIASRAAFLSFSSNAVLMVLKLAVGLAFGSVAVLGDGIDSAEDLFASALTFFSVRLALQPADEEHPYGHGKAESLSAMSQGALIAAGAVFIAISATRRLFADDVSIAVPISLITMGITVLVNVLVALYSLRAARISGSVAIAADARHLLTNVIQAGAVIVALVLVGLTGNHIYDPMVALALAAYLLWVAFGILRAAASELIDTSLPANELAQLEACFAHEEHGMRGYHALRSRKSGRQKYIDVHVLVDPQITVSQSHALVEDLEHDIHGVIPGAVVSIHVDPDEPGIMERADHDDNEPSGDDKLLLHRH